MPRHVMTFRSLAELADAAMRHEETWNSIHGNRPERYGVHNLSEAQCLALKGWSEQLPEALGVAEEAIAKVDSEQTLTTFMPTFDVTGSDVDIARYLSGEPECMIDYPMVPIVKAGRVITLCASISISGSVSTDTIIRRGQTITALALALGRLGYACEIWTDLTVSGSDDRSIIIRTLVKSAHDVIDPESILYALAHPSMLRGLHFAAMHGAPETYRRACRAGSSYGRPADPEQDLPDGTIYLPCLLSSRDVPDADVAIMRYLCELDIVPAEPIKGE